MLITRSITVLVYGGYILFLASANDSKVSDIVLDKCVGDDVILTCAFNTTYPYWYGPEIQGIPLAHHKNPALNPFSTPVEEGRLTYCENQRDLQIKKLKKTDSGKYYCLLLSAGKHNIMLNVIEPPTMSQRISSESVNLLKHEGDNVTLECPGEVEYPKWIGPKKTCLPVTYVGNPKPNPNHDIVKSGRLSFASNKKDLRLTNLQVDDGGFYTCYISPTKMYSSYLTVLGETSFTSRSSEAVKTVLTNQQITRLLVCCLLTLPQW